MPAQPPRPDVRGRILDTALELLAEHGAAHLTQPRVSRAAGVRQSHLTYYFPKRSDLLLGVARHSMEALAGPLLDQARRGALRREQLTDIVTDALTDRRRIRVMLGIIAAAEEDAQVREALRELIAHIRTRLASLLGAFGLPHDAASIALMHTFVVGAAVLHHARADDDARHEAHQMVAAAMKLLGSGEDRA